MLKLTIYTSLLLTLILYIAIATADDGSSNYSSVSDRQLLIPSIYASLYSAIEMDSADEIKQFISFGADINHRYEGAKTPLMLASSMGNIDATLALLELGANRKLVSVENFTAMNYAKKSGNLLVVTALNENSHTAKADSEITLIKKIQFLLGRLGYDAGKVDGDYGKRTKQSLETFTINTKQTFPPELSNRQVESLKIVFFKQDLNQAAISTDKITNDTSGKNTEESIAIIETIPLGNSFRESN